MKLIIAGSRDLHPTDVEITEAIDAFVSDSVTIDAVLCGGAKGVDEAGAQWAKRRNIEVETHQADWERNGKAAGPMRNRTMAEIGDQLLAFWDGQSKGTANMIDEMRRLGKPVHIVMK